MPREESEPTIYRVVLFCSGVPAHLGEQAATDITKEFTHRIWHQNVTCSWDGTTLTLQADNDYDEDGKALLDEFSDTISGYISTPFERDIVVGSITRLSH